MNMTDTDKHWLEQITTTARAAAIDILKLRKKNYDGWIPPEVAELRALKGKVQEHDGILAAVKRGIMGIAGAFDKKK